MKISHVPPDYVCPICLGIAGVESKDTMLRRGDLVYSDELVFVFINSFWIKSVEGHVIVVSREHIENIYELPDNVGARISSVTKKMSVAIRETYKADGITIRQNNEPAGDQHALHFHQHIFPRYNKDTFNQSLTFGKFIAEPSDREVYGDRLRNYLRELGDSSSSHS